MLGLFWISTAPSQFPTKKVIKNPFRQQLWRCWGCCICFCYWCVCYGSVVGLSFDYVVLNFTKQASYLIYNATLFFSPIVQKQYFDKYGYDQVQFFLPFLPSLSNSPPFILPPPFFFQIPFCIISFLRIHFFFYALFLFKLKQTQYI